MTAESDERPSPYLEFVCLRRFGSFTPFMPRPAAVSAVGGGYLVRMPRSAPDAAGTRPRMFNIVIDPGEGAVNNPYAMGLSIADIDMVAATHDHPEHLAALDAVLSLRREMRERDRGRPAGSNRAVRSGEGDALSLVRLDPGHDPQPVSLLSQDAMTGGDQLYLRGLLEVGEHMAAAAWRGSSRADRR